VRANDSPRSRVLRWVLFRGEYFYPDRLVVTFAVGFQSAAKR